MKWHQEKKGKLLRRNITSFICNKKTNRREDKRKRCHMCGPKAVDLPSFIYIFDFYHKVGFRKNLSFFFFFYYFSQKTDVILNRCCWFVRRNKNIYNIFLCLWFMRICCCLFGKHGKQHINMICLCYLI